MTDQTDRPDGPQKTLFDAPPRSASAPTGALCERCHVWPGTQSWVGEGGVLAYTHGMKQWWCDRCVLEEQIAFARRMAARLPDLEAQLQAKRSEPGPVRSAGPQGHRD